MITKEKMNFAIKQVIENCLKVKQGEETCVITDSATKHIGLAIADRFKQIAGNVKVFMMEDFGSRPEDGANPLKFPKEIDEAIRNADVSVYAAGGKKGEYTSFRAPMIEAIDSNEKLRHAHMISIDDSIMEMGVSVDYALVQKISKQVYDIVSNAKRIRVTTSKGTDFLAEFDPNLKWVICDGDIKPGHWTNLPDGEVFTCPKSVNGKVVVDGVLGDYLIGKGVIEETPLELDIMDGRVKNVVCANTEIKDEVSKYIKQEENANRIGEFAIGTNVGLTKLIGNLLQDEKFPGVHIAVGYPFPEKTGASWDAKVHMDMVIQKTTIEVDGKTIMKDGKFQL